MAFSAFLPSLVLLLGFFVFIFYSAEVNELPGFSQHFICCRVELSHVPDFFFFYFRRVEVKLTCCTLDVFHKPGLFCVFTLWLSCLAFLFLSPIPVKLTSFLDFMSVLSAVAWNYDTCEVFFFIYFWMFEVKVTCCNLEVFHEPGFFCLFTISGSLAWLFCSYLL